MDRSGLCPPNGGVGLGERLARTWLSLSTTTVAAGADGVEFEQIRDMCVEDGLPPTDGAGRYNMKSCRVKAMIFQPLTMSAGASTGLVSGAHS